MVPVLPVSSLGGLRARRAARTIPAHRLSPSPEFAEERSTSPPAKRKSPPPEDQSPVPTPASPPPEDLSTNPTSGSPPADVSVTQPDLIELNIDDSDEENLTDIV